MTLVRFGHQNPSFTEEDVILAFKKYGPKDSKVNRMAAKREAAKKTA